MSARPPEDTGRPLVLVCGLPGSGNRALERLVEGAGADAWILHGTPSLPEGDPDHAASRRRCAEWILERGRPGRQVALLPVRSERWRAPTFRKTFYRWHARWPSHVHVGNLMRVLSEQEVPTRLVSYEAFVEHPEHTQRWIVAWINEALGVDLAPGPTCWVHDGNQKYREDGRW